MAFAEAQDPRQYVVAGMELAQSQPDSQQAIEQFVSEFQGTDDPDARAMAFTSLMHATQESAHTIALRLVRDPVDAQDVTQDAYRKVWQYLDGFKNQARFTTWLYRTVHNAAISHLTKRKPLPIDTQEDFDEKGVISEPLPSPELMAERHGEYAPLYQAVGQLALIDREIIRLRYTEELGHDEIAAQLGITVANSKVRLHRAMKQLRLSLD